MTPYYIFISTKRGSIIRHSTSTLRRAGQNFGHAQGGENGHSGEILCLAASEDGKWLVSGGRDKVMGVWDVSGREPKWVTGLKGHKDAVTVSYNMIFWWIKLISRVSQLPFRHSTTRHTTSSLPPSPVILLFIPFLRSLSSTHFLAIKILSRLSLLSNPLWLSRLDPEIDHVDGGKSRRKFSSSSEQVERLGRI